MAIEIFFSYAHEDEDLMNQVRRQLVIYERQGRILKWHDRQIPPGSEWDQQIDHRLRSAHIILLFVSPAFLESKYCWDVEVTTALERHARAVATVIPVILRPCAWEAAPFAKLQALPQDGRPVSQWDDRDQVCLDIAHAVMDVVTECEAADYPAQPPLDPPRPEVERRKLDGDRIARIFVPFTPPKGTNIPPEYRRRLNYIASEAARDSAVRSAAGGYQYPAQFNGASDDIRSFVKQVSSRGRVQALGIDNEGEKSALWFEYIGELAPRHLRDLAVAANLEVVHCGAWLVGSPGA